MTRTTARPAFAFVIEEGKAHEFARATGTDGLVPDDVGWLAPPTFLPVSQLWMAQEHNAWHGITRNYGRVLHGEQRFEYPRGLPRAGDRFLARQAFGRSFEKKGNQGRMHFQEVVTRFWQNDESNPDAIMTSLSITLPPIDDAPAEAAQKDNPGTAKPAPETAGAEGASAELDRYVTEPLSITDFVRYQGASGDFNPIHHDPEFAQRGGYDRPFAVGMLTAGVAAARFNEVRDPLRLRALRMRWQAPAWPGDRLTYVVTEEDGGLKCAVTRSGPIQGDRTEPHMTAWGMYA